MTPDLIYFVGGLGLLLAIVLPRLLQSAALSPPIVLIVVGMLIGLSPLGTEVSMDPVQHRILIEHLTEITVLVALMGVGLALDRPVSLRDRRSWVRWSPAWRLLGITMPLSIIAVALLGWWAAGLPPAAALLLAGALAPTDPVLASDVQVAGPADPEEIEAEPEEIDEEDEVRFALTSEAGLNDGLAFPFVYLAILWAAEGLSGEVIGRWLGWYVVGKVVIGAMAGMAVGWALGRVAFRARTDLLRVAEQRETLLAVAAMLTAYGAAELVGGYGFLAVFACAMTIRSEERHHEYHRAMHEVIERLERLLTLFVLLALGVALTRGLLGALDTAGVMIGVALILVIRPLTGIVGLGLGARDPERRGGLDRRERMAAAFFGVRGVGSIYYLAYALGHADFARERWLWSTVAFTIMLSVLVHGVASTPGDAPPRSPTRGRRGHRAGPVSGASTG
ncbi:MAG: cation:proton antiporter [Actinobacteria bacterium]|nr:cation:proton antiporter [Actinomycetota bacterium]